ncbi:metalloprotease family protein [Clostridium estertheticum]|uniref:metalloprotease family protein n=1 Tax=Clostridium estertheticum TaxID=238834 RepID=UPI0013E8F827|nr:metalloprotease family protein [Clostridium estertheticum]MBZ9686629.1 metalloprotease family protein [Clostridium estertheticum]
MNFLIDLIIKTSVDTIYLTGMIILVGFILGYMRDHSMRNFQRSFGWKTVAVTAIIGVPIHEMSHAIFCLIFGHKITKIVLIQKRDENGVLGYVSHAYNPNSIYQQAGNFFIGIAPIFGGISVIIALMHIIIPRTYNEFINISLNNLNITKISQGSIEAIINSYIDLIKTIFSINNFGNPYFIIFLFLAICISSHISLSSADIKGASKGLIIIFLLILVINGLGFSRFFMAESILKYNIILIGFLIVSLIFSSITYLVSLLLLTIKN